MAFVDDLVSGSNYPGAGSFEFKSSDHIRYQNGINVSGHNYNCHRTVKIEKNVSGNKGYTVTIFNDDGAHPFWGSNVQMSPKPMEVISKSLDEIVLRGYGYDERGLMMGVPRRDASFDCYGLTIRLSNGSVESCVLHMHDRGIDLAYFS